MNDLKAVELFAWVGEDDRMDGPRTDDIGIKQAVCAAGCIPMVAVTVGKMSQEYIRQQMETLAAMTGKKRYLARFTFQEVVAETKGGSPLGD
jgi:hypothetical protein